MKKYLTLGFLLILIFFSGCMTDPYYNKTQIGTFAGITSGALLGGYMMSGNGVAGSAFGALFGGILGGVIGNSAGSYLDYKTQQKINSTAYQALNYGRPGQVYSWYSNNMYGTFVPTSQYISPYERTYCREFYQTIVIGGRQERAFGKACRMQDGSWKIVN